MSQISETVLVTGASGQLGRLVLEELLKKGHKNIIATTRKPESLDDFSKRGVIVRSASFGDPKGLAKAFEGADRVLLISTDNIGNRIQEHGNAVDAAVQAGVKRILYTSMIDPDHAPVTFAFEHAGTEEKIRKSGLHYTILRNGLYSDYLIPKLQHAAASGTLAGSGGEGACSYVTRLDCAKAAASALVAPSSGNLVLDITGPKAWTYSELAKLTGELTHKNVSYLDLPAEELSKGLVGVGIPKPMADALASFDISIREGYMKGVSTSVKDLTGEEPEDAKGYLEKNKSLLLS
ncbi:SDR family oxidoreductase [Leptospira wolffii]|uniref:SDR family oxidoreductase n=1 Tax=Leptospira wolffii TaxID=409998 RepID=UPI0010848813|nr:SDR family oxidoreductase [Leptospira wolffii]TGK56105.1 SDR family oxidoreductase [Leptospira wolffii]TGK72151.1 SDR family oxidoreductase [Leptospira wolffii]TGK77455.1 SDR family oxidoreductase [Leptospira wolffii]TGL27728.1 SDR family oxidoreductase [Leptospira wolffii]